MIVIANDEKKYVRDAFNGNGVTTIKEKLPIGDFIVGNYIIERKQINDLYSSLSRGSLFRQLDKIKDFCETHEDAVGILLIEGTKLHKKLKKIASLMSVEDIMGNALVVFNIIPIRTDDLDQTVSFIKGLNNYSFRDVKHVIQDVRGYKPVKSVKAQQKYFLQGLPTVGPKRVNQIMNKYDSPMDYFVDTVINNPKTIVYKVLTGEMNGKKETTK